MSKRQTVNSICSKEAELIGADNVLPAFLWLRYFIDAQKLNVKEAVIYQDNHSDVLLDNNFRLSSGNRTKHILVRYFMIKDLIAWGT